MQAHKPRLAVGVDPGITETRCVICALDGTRLRFLGFGQAPPAGWSKGKLADAAALSASIREAVQRAESSAHALVESCVVGIGGMTVQGAQSHGLYEFGRPREIQTSDMAYAVERARNVRLESDRILLNMFPQDFVLDGRAGYRNPRRATCTRLEANVHAITALRQEHDALIDAVHQAHLAVEESAFEPIAAAYASILQEDRAKGVMLVDIGSHSTDLIVYEGEAILLSTSLPIWGDHFTRDIAYIFKISYEDAENLKREYGCAMLGLTADNSLIEVPSSEAKGPREAKRRELNEVLEARAEELFLYVRNEIRKIGMDQDLMEGVVLCGGGSMLSGMCDIAERVLSCPARNGLATGIQDWPEELDSPVWTTAAGLSMYSAKLKTRRETKRQAPGLAGMVFR